MKLKEEVDIVDIAFAVFVVCTGLMFVLGSVALLYGVVGKCSCL